MEKFSTIYQRALDRKGGEVGLAHWLPTVCSKEQLRLTPPREFLAAMAKKIFQSGFVWRVVDAKWPGFEAVMWDFEPHKLALASDEQLERMAQDTRIIRNFTKVKAVRDNAAYIESFKARGTSFADFIADWPSENIVELWLALKKQGARLGGNTGPYFLRVVGKDTFILSQDLVGYLVAHRIVDKTPTGKGDLAKVQAAFNHWQQECQRPLAEISRIISCSVGENHPAPAH